MLSALRCIEHGLPAAALSTLTYVLSANPTLFFVLLCKVKCDQLGLLGVRWHTVV